MKILLKLIVTVALCASTSVHSQVAMSRSMTATRACPAYQSIRKQTNPGNVTLEVGQTYQVIGKNSDTATYYQIVIDGAAPAQRWVEITCGQTAASNAAGSSGATTKTNGGTTYVLALGWEPAFCSEHLKKTECSRETAESFDSTHLSLHGLWPQPRGISYCNVDSAAIVADKKHDWASLSEPELTASTRQRLSAVMPGFQSGLERHEWIVHGTCSGATADVYFNRAAALTEQINASKVRELFTQNIGQTLSSDAIRAAFDQAFGADSGTRVTVNCQGRGASRLISQIVISLNGDVTGSAPIGDLIGSAVSAPEGCPSGIVAAPAR